MPEGFTVIGLVTCWGPGCENQLEQLAGKRARLYCGANCRMKAFRKNGSKAPTEPYPPYGPEATVFGAESQPADAVAVRRKDADGQVVQLRPVGAAAGTVPDAPPEEPEPEPELLRLVREELEGVNKAGTWKGQQALAAAARIVAASTSAASHASLNKELDRLMSELTSTAEVNRDAADTISERTRLKLLRTDAS